MTNEEHRRHDLKLARQIIEEDDRRRSLDGFFDQFVALPLTALAIVILLILFLA